MGFYMYRQNNVGGNYEINTHLDEFVFIEARNNFHADDLAIKLGMYFDGVAKGFDCTCCGDRWKRAGSFSSSYGEQPTIYGELLSNTDSEYWIIHYLDGRIIRWEEPEED